MVLYILGGLQHNIEACQVSCTRLTFSTWPQATKLQVFVRALALKHETIESYEGANYSRARTKLIQGRGPGPRCANYSRARTIRSIKVYKHSGPLVA